jgi:hypothetical protein
MNEHEYEPTPGLPANLPGGETILWQGAPDWMTFARRTMRVRIVSAYFALLIVWGVASGLADGAAVPAVATSAARLAGLAVVAVGLLALFAWLVARTTLYTITSRRVVMRFGIALPITLQIPYIKIDSAGLHAWPTGAGDIALTLSAGQRAAYLVLWPHARPWAFARARPSFRCVPDAAEVARVLGRALAASASQPAPAVATPVGGDSGERTPMPAAA